MAAPPVITDLVERFRDNRGAYISDAYKEAQLRQEFVNPLFEALGWDVQNRQGAAEAYKDVVHEDAIRIGAFTKAPDYSFRIGGRPVFFLEVKRPAVNLAENPDPAFQLRRYAWSAKLPVSLLTDFEELAVYDTRIKPARGDKASVGRVRFYRYDDYLAKWDEIAGLFSREGSSGHPSGESIEAPRAPISTSGENRQGW